MKTEKKNKNPQKKITKITHAEIENNIGMSKTGGRLLKVLLEEKKKKNKIASNCLRI